MRCGRSAGAAIVAGVMTGVHSRERLLQGGATHIIDSIANLPELILSERTGTTRMPAEDG